MKPSSRTRTSRNSGFVLTALVLAGVLSLLLFKAFLPGWTQFSNDGPLGRHVCACHRLPERFTGGWDDLNAIGYREDAASPSISSALLLLLQPILFSKLYALTALIILGLSAWLFFRETGLAPIACTLGGLATALNSSFFSSACWGTASHPLAVAMFFLALAALSDTTSRLRWWRVALGGFAVGMGICEGADIGALYSLFVAVFVIFQASCSNESSRSRSKSAFLGIGRLALVSLCAAVLAAQPVIELISTNIKGVAGTQQDSQTREEHWDFATQWSLPKVETLSLVVPGLFGFRSDTPDGGAYWGRVGRAPAWDRFVENGEQGTPPSGFTRYSGGGAYAGVLTILLMLWAMAQSFRSNKFVFTMRQRRWIWFWLAIGVVSLAFAFGRYAPFYRLLYALPYFSTIRNPAKFLSFVSVCIVVLSAYGIDGLWRIYLSPTRTEPTGGKGKQKLSAWQQASDFEKKWLFGCLFLLGVGLLGWLMYSSDKQLVTQFMSSTQVDEGLIPAIVDFSTRQVGWFLLYLSLAAGLTLLIIFRRFSKTQARMAGVLLGLLLVADLGRANLPWIVFLRYDQTYAGNAILSKLSQQPYEHRLALMPLNLPPSQAMLPTFYKQKWVNLVFPYYNIQTMEVVQMSRLPEDFKHYADMLSPTNQTDYTRILARTWQLLNVGYLIGPAISPEEINRQFDPSNSQFRIVDRFEIVPEPGASQPPWPEEMTASVETNGQYAIWEFTGTLPRAKLFSHWQENTNDESVLAQLPGPSFDPSKLVLVSDHLPPPPSDLSQAAATDLSKVEFVHYAPKDISLSAESPAASVLLLNDHYDPNWKVTVDGRPENLLRCNYIMRGVYLQPGKHSVRFQFRPPQWPLYVSLSGIVIGILMLSGMVLGSRARSITVPENSEPPARPENELESAIGPAEMRSGKKGRREKTRV